MLSEITLFRAFELAAKAHANQSRKYDHGPYIIHPMRVVRRLSWSYQDTWHCDHCDKETLHEVHDSDHERDSSGDMRTCKECGWYYSGYNGNYNPPPKED